MTQKKIEKMFKKHDALLHKLSHQCSRRCWRPEEECYGQACYLFTLAANRFRDDQGAQFISYLYSCVLNGLHVWGKKNDLPPDPENIPEQRTMIDPSYLVEIKDWVENLPEECREVAMIILNGPAEILKLGTDGGKKITAGAIKNFLRSKGWSWPKIWKTIHALKAEVAAL